MSIKKLRARGEEAFTRVFVDESNRYAITATETRNEGPLTFRIRLLNDRTKTAIRMGGPPHGSDQPWDGSNVLVNTLSEILTIAYRNMYHREADTSVYPVICRSLAKQVGTDEYSITIRNVDIHRLLDDMSSRKNIKRAKLMASLAMSGLAAAVLNASENASVN